MKKFLVLTLAFISLVLTSCATFPFGRKYKLPVNISETLEQSKSFEKVEFENKFGQLTGDIGYSQSILGTFSNSATLSSNFNGFFIFSVSEKAFYFKIFEYGKYKKDWGITGNEYSEKNYIEFLYKDEIKKDIINANGFVGEYGCYYLYQALLEGDVKCIITEYYSSGKVSSSYKFTLKGINT